ncbi:MAG TPA: hypothetical protein VGG10_13780 [Rhizomicrobium sp.]
MQLSLSGEPELPRPVFGLPTTKQNTTGLIASALLHALFALLVLTFLSHRATITQTISKVLPVDIVHLADETESPAALKKAAVPRQASAPRGQSSSLAPAGVSHDEKKPLPEDAFDAKLKALSQLRQPDAELQPLDNSGVDADTASNGASGGHASYSLRDFVRAQVIRHWNLDYSMLGGRRFTIAIRVAMTSQGTIDSAEIVDKTRYAGDAIFREIALSARNAVTLSSPIPLPPGDYQPVMNFTITLDPRDAAR